MFGWKKEKGSRPEEAQKDRLRQPRFMDGQDAYTFRRSRTLTGSAANSVNTSKTARTDLQSERLKLHSLRRRRRAIQSVLFGFILLSAGTFMLLQNSFALSGLAFEGQVEVPSEEQSALRQSINEYINQRPAEAFLFSLNASRLTSFLQKDHAEIASITTGGSLLTPRQLTVTFRQPIVVWQSGRQKFFVDKNGIAFQRHYGVEPALKVEDTSGFTSEKDGVQTVASRRFINYLGQLLGAIEQQQAGTVERIVIPASTRQLDVYLQGRGYPIKTHIDRDPYAQVEDIRNSLAFLDEKQITPEYLDVRVEGKAFYK